MNDKVEVECEVCGLELTLNREYWEKECASEEQFARVCPLCKENRGLTV